MEILWAPWRLNYVKKAGKEKTPCFICKAIEERDDEKNLLLHRGKLAVVILNRYPYNPGHLMVCPVRHTGDFTGLLEEELVEINKLIQRAIRVIKIAFNPDGFNVGLNLGKVSGGSVDTHIHFHVVPRWLGDTNFMPIVGKVKVIPQLPEDTYKILKEYWDKNV
jgi:ATP adenylyltransferase